MYGILCCAFMVGSLQDGEDQVQNLVLPKLFSINSPFFDFLSCDFSEKNMRSKDKFVPMTFFVFPSPPSAEFAFAASN